MDTQKNLTQSISEINALLETRTGMKADAMANGNLETKQFIRWAMVSRPPFIQPHFFIIERLVLFVFIYGLT